MRDRQRLSSDIEGIPVAGAITSKPARTSLQFCYTQIHVMAAATEILIRPPSTEGRSEGCRSWGKSARSTPPGGHRMNT